MTLSVTSNLVAEMLREYGSIARAATAKYLPRREPSRYLYDLLSDYPNRGGKMMRPSLCIATARMFGAPMENSVNTAVAIELLHNALLIHDDIEDSSEQRRGRPTLHALHGIPLALNAGDTLAFLSLEPLLDNRRTIGDQLAFRIFEDAQRMARECAEGQALELGWRRDNRLDLTEADYFEMVLKKTCWLATIFPLRAGALIGSRGRVDLEPYLRFGFFLGAAFQIQDDLLNLVADDTYGKELNGDLWEGKRTLMLLHAFQKASADESARVRDIFGRMREERSLEEVAWIRELIGKYDAIEYARRIANELAGAALHEYSILSDQLPDSRDKRFLDQMPTWVIERT
jgi:geranylgeranyl diphosphate synthase type II